jgi:hypothetical protein
MWPSLAYLFCLRPRNIYNHSKRRATIFCCQSAPRNNGWEERERGWVGEECGRGWGGGWEDDRFSEGSSLIYVFLQTIDGLTEKHTGKFLNYNGDTLPY